MASAEELGDLFAGLPPEEKQKFMHQLSSLHGAETGDKPTFRVSPQVATSIPPKKAVNGFMAFRSYYSILFTGLQQKQRSPFLRRLYDADPFHAEWEFVARIYSHVRNEVLKLGKQAPIRAFLAMACPVMNMVPPDEYLATCGWTLVRVGGENGHHELKRDDDGDTRLQSLRKTTPPLNGFDLLLQCLANGYQVHYGQQVLCGMMERQEHLMTKSFLVSEPTGTSDERSTPDSVQAGDFFTWGIDKASPAPKTAPDETSIHSQGGDIIRFDDFHQQFTQSALGEQRVILYGLDMSMGYKYGSDSGDGFHNNALAMDMNEIAGVSGHGNRLDSGTGNLGEGADGGNPFGIVSDFGDPFINETLSFGHDDGF